MRLIKTTDRFKLDDSTAEVNLGADDKFHWAMFGNVEGRPEAYKGKMTRHDAINDAVKHWASVTQTAQMDFTFKITPTRFGTDWGELTVTAPSYERAVDRMKARLDREEYDYDDYDLLTVTEAK